MIPTYDLPSTFLPDESSVTQKWPLKKLRVETKMHIFVWTFHAMKREVKDGFISAVRVRSIVTIKIHPNDSIAIFH